MNTSILSLVSLMIVGLASGTYRSASGTYRRRGRYMQPNFRTAHGHDHLVQSRLSPHHGINTGPEVRVSGGSGVDHVDTEIRQIPHGNHLHTVTRKVAHVYSGNNMMQAGRQSNGYNPYGSGYNMGGMGGGMMGGGPYYNNGYYQNPDMYG